MLLPGETCWVQLEDLAREGDSDLSNDNDSPHSKEHEVLVHAFKDILLIMDLSGANHIPDLHEYEEVEDPSHVT